MPKPPRFAVESINKDVCREMVLRFHYSGRMPGIKHCWGLTFGNDLVGCVVYSIPASYTLCQGVCGPAMTDKVIELSRLVIITGRNNAASFLIGHSLRLLPPLVVVSYADANEHVGHVGYVYQATNWLYTGRGNAEPAWLHPVTGEVVSFTRRHIDQKALQLGLNWKDLIQQKQVGKHRYVTFTGDRRFKRAARESLRYVVLPYPKGNTQRHEIDRQAAKPVAFQTESFISDGEF